MKQSLRLRLAFSYVLLALLVIFILGTILLLTLRSYYRGLEVDYLTRNGQALAMTIRDLGAENIEDSPLPAMVYSFSLLSQLQVRIVDMEQSVIIDTGLPPRAVGLAAPALAFGNSDEMFSSPSEGPPREGEIVFHFVGEEPVDPPENGNAFVFKADSGPGLSSWVFSPGVLEQRAVLAYTPRSPVVVRVGYLGADGALSGYVELSNGPAFGQEVVNSVTRALLLAGGVSILLAVLTGVMLSRQISAPVRSLTDVTKRMQAGDLSARTSLDRADEIGLLSVSFNQMAARIESTVDTLRQFVSDAAHEIFTPITAARTQMELALQEPDDRSHLEQALEQLARLEALTANLLNLSRLETPEASVERERIALDQLLARIAEPFAAQAEQAGVSFGLAGLDRSLTILANRKQIEQLVSNLLSNAVKFTPAGGSIQVSLTTESRGVQILVEDTGIGIPAEDVPHLFERFHRGRNTADIAGSGLGLAISKAITVNHDGRIWTEPTEQGTRFIVQLPYPGS